MLIYEAPWFRLVAEPHAAPGALLVRSECRLCGEELYRHAVDVEALPDDEAEAAVEAAGWADVEAIAAHMTGVHQLEASAAGASELASPGEVAVVAALRMDAWKAQLLEDGATPLLLLAVGGGDEDPGRVIVHTIDQADLSEGLLCDLLRRVLAELGG